MAVKKPVIMTVLGTRPEAIKLFPVIKRLEMYKDCFISKVIVTAQHRAMLDQMLDYFKIKPDIDLDLMSRDQSLQQLGAKIMEKITGVIDAVKPDLLLVQGDTTTAFMGALAGFYKKIPVGHVEAGLRTDDIYNPFPEEANRRMISIVAAWHFSATQGAAMRLIKEGISRDKIFVTGNTVVDALYQTLADDFEWAEHIGEMRDYVLVTMHRRESFGPDFREIMMAVFGLALLRPDINIFFPVHPNPAVKKAVSRVFKKKPKNLLLMDPMPYNVFVNFMIKAKLVITDSGGIQEEATALGLPVIVCRQVTERPEAIRAGAVLAGSDKEVIIRKALDFLESDHRKSRGCDFGDGKAAKRIVDALLWIYKKRKQRPRNFQ